MDNKVTKLDKMRQRFGASDIDNIKCTGEELAKLNERLDDQKKKQVTSAAAIDRWLERAMQNIGSAHHELKYSKDISILKKPDLKNSMKSVLEIIHDLRSVLEIIHDLRAEIETSKIEK
jgi:GTPase involved in cell partitioning and DNA repair